MSYHNQLLEPEKQVLVRVPPLSTVSTHQATDQYREWPCPTQEEVIEPQASANQILEQEPAVPADGSSESCDVSHVTAHVLVDDCHGKPGLELAATGAVVQPASPAATPPGQPKVQSSPTQAAVSPSQPESELSSKTVQRRSPVTSPAGSPVKARRSPLKVRAVGLAKAPGTGAGGAQRQLWGHVRKTAVVNRATETAACTAAKPPSRTVSEHQLQLI